MSFFVVFSRLTPVLLSFNYICPHAEWRYEHFIWTFQLDAGTRERGRARHPRAIDSLIDVSATFIPGRAALALVALIRDVFQGGIPPVVRPWIFGGRLIALKNDRDGPSSRRFRDQSRLAVSLAASFPSVQPPPPPSGSSASSSHPPRARAHLGPGIKRTVPLGPPR